MFLGHYKGEIIANGTRKQLISFPLDPCMSSIIATCSLDGALGNLQLTYYP
jgi:hypothetical protein